MNKKEEISPTEQGSEVVLVAPNIKKRVFARKDKIEIKREGKKEFQDTKLNKNKLKIMFFGGSGEVGKNLTALCYGDDILL